MDQDRKREIERRIAQAEALKEESEMQIAILSTKIREAEQAKTDLERYKAQIEERKRAVNDARRRIQTQQMKLCRCLAYLDLLASPQLINSYVSVYTLFSSEARVTQVSGKCTIRGGETRGASPKGI